MLVEKKNSSHGHSRNLLKCDACGNRKPWGTSIFLDRVGTKGMVKPDVEWNDDFNKRPRIVVMMIMLFGGLLVEYVLLIIIQVRFLEDVVFVRQVFGKDNGAMMIAPLLWRKGVEIYTPLKFNEQIPKSHLILEKLPFPKHPFFSTYIYGKFPAGNSFYFFRNH